MLQFIDSFDHYTSSSITEKYTTVNFSPEVTAGAGVCGTNSLQFNAFDQLVKGIAFGTTTVGFGHWLRINESDTGVLIALGGIGHALGRHLIMYRAYDGSLLIYRNDAPSGLSTTFLGSTPPDVIRDGDEYYVEMKAKIHDSTGTVDVRVNGVNVLALTGLDTLGSSSAVTSFWFGNENGNGSSNFDIDNLYIFDTSAGNVTDFIGPVHVEFLHADGAGAHISDFSLVGAATQWEAVEDLTGPDGDTSYVQSSTVNHLHTSTFSNTALPSGTIYGVQVNIAAKVTDAGFRGVKPVIRQGGTDYLGTEQAPGTSYRYLHQAFEEDPSTASAWNIAGVNAAEFGAKVTT